MKQLLGRVSITGGLILAGASPAFASSFVNLLDNGNFSLGNYGFESGYVYSSGSSSSCWGEGTYDIVSDPHACHPLWASFGDHTTGTGNMLVVNGAPTPGLDVWAETVAVTPDTNYTFSGWLASLYPLSPAVLQASVNGTSLGLTVAPAAAGSWQPFAFAWNSGLNTTATLSLIDLNLVADGNDFALDDLSFVDPPAVPTPEPLSLLLLGTGLSGTAFVIRRRRTMRPGA